MTLRELLNPKFGGYFYANPEGLYYEIKNMRVRQGACISLDTEVHYGPADPPRGWVQCLTLQRDRTRILVDFRSRKSWYRNIYFQVTSLPIHTVTGRAIRGKLEEVFADILNLLPNNKKFQVTGTPDADVHVKRLMDAYTSLRESHTHQQALGVMKKHLRVILAGSTNDLTTEFVHIVNTW